MGLAATMAYVKGLLDGVKCPGGAGTIEAFVLPPDPEIQARNPHVYVWASRFEEKRNSGPRAPKPSNSMTQFVPSQPAGWKIISHSLDIYITWFNDNTDPQADSSFPLVVDIVMQCLRNSDVEAVIVDPGTGAPSALISLGKEMNGTYAPVKDTASQRQQRFDALIVAPVEEWFQA